MTILDILKRKYENNKSIEKSLEIIKETFTGLVNDNYELIIDEKGELNVKIPSLEKRDEYVYTSIVEYEYNLVMCMRIMDMSNPDGYNYIISKFMELYKDKLEVFFKDVNTVDKLMEKIKSIKNNVDCITYCSIGAVIIGGIFLCVFTDMSTIMKRVLTSGIIIFFICALAEQVTKENQVKKAIDGYISIIKTEWYRKELRKQSIFLCNYME